MRTFAGPMIFSRELSKVKSLRRFLASLDRSRWREFGSPFVSIACLTFLEILRAHNFAGSLSPGAGFNVLAEKTLLTSSSRFPR